MLDAGFPGEGLVGGCATYERCPVWCGRGDGAGAKTAAHSLWPDYDLKDLVDETAAKFPNVEAALIMKEYEV